MKAIKSTLDAKRSKRFGNYYVQIDGCIRTCSYRSTVICMVNDVTKEYFINKKKITTLGNTKATNEYIKELDSRGFTESSNNYQMA